jgi:hypothetical protein
MLAVPRWGRGRRPLAALLVLALLGIVAHQRLRWSLPMPISRRSDDDFCTVDLWRTGRWTRRNASSLQELSTVAKHDGFFRVQNFRCPSPEYGCLARPIDALKTMASYEWSTPCRMAAFDPAVVIADMISDGGWFFVGGKSLLHTLRVTDAVA